MDKTEFLGKITEIGTCEDDVQRRSMLDELRDSVSEVYDNNDTLTKANQEYETANEKLRKANMEMFLKIGEQKSPEQVIKDTTGVDPDKNKKRSFDDLFDEKGYLK